MSETIQYIKPLLELFETSLADVRFADLDATTLTRAVAETTVAEEALVAAQAVVDGARAKLHENQEALLQAAHRAIAYARVYAEQDEELSARVAAIVLPRPVRRTRSAGDALVLSPDPAPALRGAGREAGRPRGRPRKVAPLVTSQDVLASVADNAE